MTWGICAESGAGGAVKMFGGVDTSARDGDVTTAGVTPVLDNT